jgi:hypothetical protein
VLIAWRVKKKEGRIFSFIRNHPQEINLGKVDQMWFLDLILLRGRKVSRAKPSRVEIRPETLLAGVNVGIGMMLFSPVLSIAWAEETCAGTIRRGLPST